MAREISNTDKYIDSRDIIRRIRELEDLIEEAEDPENCCVCGIPVEDDENGVIFDEEDGRLIYHLDCADGVPVAWEIDEEREELALLKKLADEGESYPDWSYGATLVRESEIGGDYAFERAVDFGYITDRDAMNRWPFNHMDWEAAAEDLTSDATGVDFGGVTYYIGL